MLSHEAQLVLLVPVLIWVTCFLIYNSIHGDDSNDKKN